MKPYLQVPIQECNEPLVPIPLEEFALESPHPYEKLGAPYGKRSPYYLRQSVLAALLTAQRELQQYLPAGKIKIFDAYRPLEVQQFMVDYTFQQVLQQRNLGINDLSPAQQEAIWQEVYQIWAVPSSDPLTPPPHSTGAAIDVTLVDAQGQELDMGCAIDEMSPRAQADYYATSTKSQEQQYQHHREILHQSMLKGGFKRHRGEWWHFSLGDQMWAWLSQQDEGLTTAVARYGQPKLV